MLRRPRAIVSTKASVSDRLRAVSSSASDSGPDSHCSSHGLTLATPPKRTRSARSSLARELGVHHQPAHLGAASGCRCASARPRRTASKTLASPIDSISSAVEHQHLQVAGQPPARQRKRSSWPCDVGALRRPPLERARPRCRSAPSTTKPSSSRTRAQLAHCCARAQCRLLAADLASVSRPTEPALDGVEHGLECASPRSDVRGVDR